MAASATMRGRMKADPLARDDRSSPPAWASGRLPFFAAAGGLAGAVATTVFLHAFAVRALDRVLHERLRAAGSSAADSFVAPPPSAERLRAFLVANSLAAGALYDGRLAVVIEARRDPAEPTPGIDAVRAQLALAGNSTVGPGRGPDIAGYFPVRGPGGVVTSVLALEAGPAFVGAREGLRSALALGITLSLLCAVAMTVVAARWSRSERARREAADRAAQGETLTRLAAMAAHEVRNPLAVIRGTIELLRERLGAQLTAGEQSSMDDVIKEVERLRRLSDDLLDLAADRPLAFAPLDLQSLLVDAARATESSYRNVRVRCDVAPLPPVAGDAGRLRQVFANLLANAAQSQHEGELLLQASRAGPAVLVRIHDQGPGVPPEVMAHLFQPFVTSKATGTGLGLAVSRKVVERHGGQLRLLQDGRPGATFEVRLPAATAEVG